MTNLGQMLKQAQQMQSKMQEMQDQLAELEVTGTSGGGMCQVTLNGKGEARNIKIDPALVTPDDAEVLEDLIRSEEHTSELQSLAYLVCRLLLEKKKTLLHRQNRSENDS